MRGEHTGIGYSPDPSYEGQGIKTIKYKNINDLRGWLKPGFQVTTDIDPNRTDELSDNLKIGHETFADAGAISIRFWYPIRQEVDLWYHEDFNGKMNYYIKIESTGRNRENPKNMVLDDIYRNVPEKEITDTIRILGFNRDSFEKGSRPVGWLDQIILSQYQRTFTGLKTWLPAGVDADTAIKSVQKWYGEYYLPNDLFASAKGYDVTEYGRTHNGLNGKESFWLKDGFIIVNFQIESVQNNDFNNPILSYGGSSWCNMFQREGFAYVKTDNNSIAFNLQDGDIVFYDTDRRSSDDYQIGGTH